uniref:Thyroglobulin type-1 domain-containing protein n=1 Tax=Oryzias latipes TaxID=8090 RepID=H2LJ69_ORYLA
MPAHTITPPPPWATPSTTLTSENRSPTRRHTRCLPSALNRVNRDSSVKRTPLQRARQCILIMGAQCPQCAADGNFLPRQCSGSTGYCWCVNVTTGEMIPNSRVPPGHTPPKCGA